MSGQTAKDEWVARVLGVHGAAGGAPTINGVAEDKFLVQWDAARASWQSAIETVDGQIAALQSALRKEDTPDLRAIADSGLNAVTGDHKVKLMAALMDISNASGKARAAACAKAQQIALDFGLHLSSDPRVAACDKNPFAVPVSVVATLGPALARLETVLEAGKLP